jgi:hypothetical protein
MGWACGTYVGVGEYVHGAGAELRREGKIWKDWKICFRANDQKHFLY